MIEGGLVQNHKRTGKTATANTTRLKILESRNYCLLLYEKSGKIERQPGYHFRCCFRFRFRFVEIRLSIISIMNQTLEVIRVMQSFLSNDDYHYFLNTSKALCGEVKRKTTHPAPNREKSGIPREDKSFQTLLLSKVENGWNQIAVIYESDEEY